MIKTIVVLYLLTLLASCSSKEITGTNLDKIENVKDNDSDEDDSASIQVVRRDTTTENISTPVNDDIPVEQINSGSSEVTSSIQNDTNSNLDIVSDSDDTTLETKSKAHVDKKTVHTNDHSRNIKLSDQEAIEIVIEDITESHDTNENNSSPVSEDENNWKSSENNWRSAEHNNWKSSENNDWRSGENVQSDHSPAEVENEESVLEGFDNNYSEEEYLDKKMSGGISVKGRTEAKKPTIRERVMRPEVRQFTPQDEHGFLDSAPPIRNIAEIVVPRYRPVLTRNGIVYTPTLYTVQTASPAIPSHAWLPTIPPMPHISRDRETFTRHRHTKKLVGGSRYEQESKIIDDYHDYGTYSYTPIKPPVKLTTQAPPQQIIAPNRFDVFQKLAEASNHPKLSRRTFSDSPGNFFSRQFSENYGGLG